MNHANQPNNKINDHTKPKPGPQQFVTSSSSKIRDKCSGVMQFLSLSKQLTRILQCLLRITLHIAFIKVHSFWLQRKQAGK